MDVLLSLDLSSTSTGWSTFEISTKKLLDFGVIKPQVPGLSKKVYPEKPLLVCKSVAEQIIQLYEVLVSKGFKVKQIVIEEVNSHKNRISGKTLDVAHGILWNCLNNKNLINLVTYIDSDGFNGWRSYLKLRLSEADKELNKEAKKLNKKLPSKQQIPIITKKHLCERFVNKTYNLTFDVNLNKSDSDAADSIGLGHCYLHRDLK